MQLKIKLQSSTFTGYQAGYLSGKAINIEWNNVSTPIVGDIIDSKIIGTQLPKEDAWDNLRELTWKVIEVLWSVDDEERIVLKLTVVPAT